MVLINLVKITKHEVNSEPVNCFEMGHTRKLSSNYRIRTGQKIGSRNRKMNFPPETKASPLGPAGVKSGPSWYARPDL